MLFSKHAKKLVIWQNIECRGSPDKTAKTHITVKSLIEFVILSFFPPYLTASGRTQSSNMAKPKLGQAKHVLKLTNQVRMIFSDFSVDSQQIFMKFCKHFFIRIPTALNFGCKFCKIIYTLYIAGHEIRIIGLVVQRTTIPTFQVVHKMV